MRFVIGSIILLTLMLVGFFGVANANDVSPNHMIKECLDVWGFDREESNPQKRLDSFDFSHASGCISGFRHDEWMERIEEDRKVVERKPWLKGTNWKWEERAEYTCTKEHHTGRTVCRRPYYMN